MSESIQALRRANPRGHEDFTAAVEEAATAVHARLATPVTPSRRSPRRRLIGASALAASLAAAAAVAVVLTVGSSGVRVESAEAAMRTAAATTAASAEESGTATVRITQNGAPWAGKTVRWNGADLAVAEDSARKGRELRVVGGRMYGADPFEGGWIELGSPNSIDPDSGTTPAEYLTAVREDTGGATLQRITTMTGVTERDLADGATVYSGSVPARLIARESGFKEGHTIRVLPWGYVAHGAAADPSAALDAAVTVGPDGVIREIAVTWSPGWAYTVTYSGLGSTPAPVAPANAKPLRRGVPSAPSERP
jgi:hypothetical protein